MRRILSVLAMVLLATTLATGTPKAQEANGAIQGVIQQQIEAFLADDFDKAFTFASPNIQRMFMTSDNFGMMVRQGYPMVWRPADVQYLQLREENGQQVQRVLIQDGAGNTHVLEYQMLELPDGWRINGVQILRQSGIGA